MTEMLAFARRPGENINALLARYEVVRQRAANEGHFVMSIEGCALQILKAAGFPWTQLSMLLHQLGGRLPNTEAEYQQLIIQIRRLGHVQEAAPGNIATILQGPFRQARPGQYYVDPATNQTSAQQLQSYWQQQQQSESQGRWLNSRSLPGQRQPVETRWLNPVVPPRGPVEASGLNLGQRDGLATGRRQRGTRLSLGLRTRRRPGRSQTLVPPPPIQEQNSCLNRPCRA